MSDRFTKKLIDKFHERTQKNGFGEKCWMWKGGFSTKKYPTLCNGRRGQMFAHRYSYIYYIGPLGDKEKLSHTCGIRACVNPAHLYKSVSS